MKNLLIYLFLIIPIAYSCSYQKKKVKEQVQDVISSLDENFTSINDSTWRYTEINNDSLKIDITNYNNENFSILVDFKGQSQDYDLKELGIPFKAPELSWVNSDFVCITTWWSAPFGRYLFVPLKQLDKHVYINKDIQYADSINNNVLYIDTVINNQKVELVVENLKTRRTQKFSFNSMKEVDNYPYYDSLKMDKDALSIWIGLREMDFDISEMNSKTKKKR